MKTSSLFLALSLATIASAKPQISIYTNDDEKICFNAEEVDSIFFIGKDARNILNQHEFVDLGLPSGLRWATTNIGAESPEEYGSYFYWGGTIGQKSFSKATTPTSDQPMASLIEKGFCNEDSILTKEYDAAYRNWGEGWRMPTKKDFKELLDNTIQEDAAIKGINGTLYKSRNNSNSIFIPLAGYYSGNTLRQANEYGQYWGSTGMDTKADGIFDVYKGCGLSIDGNWVTTEYREVGCPIRAVTSFNYYKDRDPDPNDAPVTSVSKLNVTSSGSIGFSTKKYNYVDLGLKSGNLWSTRNYEAGSTTSNGIMSKWCWTPNDTVFTSDIEYLLSKGYVDSTLSYNAEYDICSNDLGKNWKVPTAEDFEELINSTEKEFVEVNSFIGLKLTGPNGNTIFFPGYENDYLHDQIIMSDPAAEQIAKYWTSTANKEAEGEAISFTFSHKGNSVKLISKPRSEYYRFRPIVNLANYKK